jgi:hypothetical protein
MSYRLDLDEYTEEALLAELKLRAERRSAARCDYCNRPIWEKGVLTSPCKFPERHKLEAQPADAYATASYEAGRASVCVCLNHACDMVCIEPNG